MPFKDAEARRAYMKEYHRLWRGGLRKGVATKPAERTLKSRAGAVKKAKRLWEIQNHEWRMQQQRERRRASRASAEGELLRGLAQSDGRAGSISKRGKNKKGTKRTTR